LKKDKNEKGGTPPKDPWYDKEKALKFVDGLFKAAGIEYELKDTLEHPIDIGEFTFQVKCKDGKLPDKIGLFYDSIGLPTPSGGEFPPSYGFETQLDNPFVIMAMNKEFISDNMELEEVLEDNIKRFDWGFDFYEGTIMTQGQFSSGKVKLQEHFRMTMDYLRQFHELCSKSRARVGIISNGRRIQSVHSSIDACRQCGKVVTITSINKRKPPGRCPTCAKSLIQFAIQNPNIPFPGKRRKIALKKLNVLKDYRA